jgi:transcriptional regulator with GAF, ATPase, and Fis domain
LLIIEVRNGLASGARHELPGEAVVVGRRPDAHVVLTDEQVSGRHLRVLRRETGLAIEDLGSTNGTFIVRGEARTRVTPAGGAVALAPGDLVELGGDGGPGVLLALSTTAEGEVEILATRTLDDVAPAAARVADEPSRLRALWRAQNAIRAGADDVGEVAQRILDAALHLVDRASHATIVLADEVADASKSTSAPLVPIATRVRDRETGLPGPPTGPVPLARAVWRRVIATREAVLAADTRGGALASESLVGAHIRGTIGVPLWRGADLLGVLQIDDREGRDLLTEADVEILLVLAETASFAVATAQLVHRLRVAEERLSRENAFLRKRDAGRERSVIGQSRAMREVLSRVKRVAETRVTVLLTGETGTGKEVVARAVHDQSRRQDALFIAQNCAAIPESLLESELFGHRRGAFTGASHDKKGLFEVADGGTLFLDEIGEMPHALQSKLLRVLQDGEIRPVGAEDARRVDVRIVAATNRDLQKEVAEGRFREDLLYRISTFTLALPALRERRDDVPLLAQAFLVRYAKDLGKVASAFTQEALEVLAAYDWPGNVRELENEVQRALLEIEDGELVGAHHLSARVRGDGAARAVAPPTGTLRDRMDAVERVLVAEALRQVGNNKTKAAKNLGLTREGLHKKLKLLGIG